ncbi:MAG: thymidine phosphorylase [Clostridiales bacterium]|nr:thymidine phosphorylase [Clostridiales bacterium]
MTFEQLIASKRDGAEHTPEQIERIVSAFATGQMPDYQMSAWLMAALLNGLTADETVALTGAMVRSGRVVDLSEIHGVKVDKHSTGGVADTTTLVVAPLVAALGVPVAKMSGRGLGHTGGTLDKLEAIPGMRVELDAEEFIEQVREVGIAVIAQSPDIDPADKKMYALRDVTATVPSIPLIVGSIISKKIAGGADAILLDVKVGSGAFMKTIKDAEALADALVRTGEALGKQVHSVMTGMDQPLGTAVGNALEVAEAIRTLKGEGPPDLTEVCLALTGKMALLGGVAADEREGRAMAERALRSGEGVRVMTRWIAAQGGDPYIVENPERLPRAWVTHEVRATRAGYVTATNAEAIGRAAMLAGAGRATPTDVIDPAAGLVLEPRIGDAVERGERIATVHAATDARCAEAEAMLLSAITISDVRTEPPPLFLKG